MSAGSSLAHGRTKSLSTLSGTGDAGEGGVVAKEGKWSGVLAVHPANRTAQKANRRATEEQGEDFTGLIIEKNATTCNFLFCYDVVQCPTHYEVIFFSPLEHR